MNHRNKISEWLKKYKIEIVIVLGGFIYIHVFLFAPAFNDWSFFMNNSGIAGQFGNFIGGYIGTIFLLVSVVLLYLTLKSQREMFQLQQFESKFFEMLRITRANSTEVESKGKKGRPVFVDIKDEIEKALELVTENDKTNKMTEMDKINIAYLITLYGVNNSLSQQLRIEAMKVIKDTELIEVIISSFEEKHREIKLKNENLQRITDNTWISMDINLLVLYLISLRQRKQRKGMRFRPGR